MKIIMKGQTIEGTPEEIISMLKLIDAPQSRLQENAQGQRMLKQCAKCATRGKPTNKLQGQPDGQKQRFIIA